jgi:heat shock protein HslJ
MRLEVVGPDTLTLLDQKGRRIDSDLPSNLVRIDVDDRLNVDVPLSGMYRYMADAAILDECSTGKRYPVLLEEAHIELERAYLGVTQGSAQPIFASFRGRIESRPRMEGEGSRDMVVVTGDVSVDPDDSCDIGANTLENVRWGLSELDGRLVDWSDLEERPYLVFDADESTVSGFGGCNRFTGGFDQTGDSLGFGRMASTMRACAEGMDLETEFLTSLSLTD